MIRASLIAFTTLFLLVPAIAGPHDGLLRPEGAPVFSIGFYHFPEDPGEARAMVEAGVNLLRCGGPDDLDRARALGAWGWVSLPMHTELTPERDQQITAILDHPALAVWEGPDEMVWNFTAYSGLFRDGTHEYRGAWWDQTPGAVAHAKAQAAIIMPNVHAWAARIRELDTKKRPIWFNEAYRSDAIYMRQYLSAVDITGCDLYPVKAAERPIAQVGDYTERFNRVGEGLPVWMVLQAFSWHELQEKSGEDLPDAYPTFAESRFMAWDAIAHGATGILYWGSAYTKNVAFLQSVYAVTRELSALQPFLTAKELPEVSVHLIEAPTIAPQRGVAHVARANNGEGLLVLINEDDSEHMGVEVRGLGTLDGRTLHLNYGDETLEVRNGRVLARLQPHEVKVFTTVPGAAETGAEGRDFGHSGSL